MRIAIFMVVCEGEYEMGCEALASLIASCEEHELEVFFLDDASPSHVARRIGERVLGTGGLPVDTLELPKSLGFRGSTQRAFMGLHRIASTGRPFDLVVKIDADALVLRKDLGAFMASTCPSGRGLYGEQHAMRWRDRVLYLADQIPFGFRRKVVDGIIQRRWQLARGGPVWWSDIGRKALWKGFRFRYIPGCFWFLGGETLTALHGTGYFLRDQKRHGFVFNDDLILTSSVRSLGHPIVDLAELSESWGTTMSMTENTPFELIARTQPYVLHPLKNNPRAWERRKELRQHFPNEGIASAIPS